MIIFESFLIYAMKTSHLSSRPFRSAFSVPNSRCYALSCGKGLPNEWTSCALEFEGENILFKKE